MIQYLLTSTITATILLVVYQLFLEKEKMHHFNRFYLLLSLIFSLLIPFISIEIIEEITTPVNTPIPMGFSGRTMVVAEETNYLEQTLWGIYVLVTAILLFRFTRNIITFYQLKKHNTTLSFQNATLVLLQESVLPHTFMNSIFINETEYQERKIEKELFAHELTHVNQKHTLDVLFVELIKTIFWFNPLFLLYKKAIQLNHEFLADEKVIATYNNVSFYQNLLLTKANSYTTYHLASNLNYFLTKKRLIMMTKTTSRTKAILKKIAIIPFICGLVYFFCFETVAQENNVSDKVQTDKKENSTKNRKDEYYAGVRIIFKDCSKKTIIDKQYEELTSEEKDKYVPDYVPTPFIEKSPTEKEFTDFKNKSKYAIWIDGKHFPNMQLNQYVATDFVYFTGSSVKKNARNTKFPQPFQYNFYTKDYFEKNLKDSWKKFGGKEIIGTRNCEDKWDKTNNFKESAAAFDDDKKAKTQISGIEKYFEKTIFVIKDENGTLIGKKKFNELSKKEMIHLPPPPPPASKRDNQTAQKFEDGQNTKGPKSVEIILVQGK
ncbi:M56 family metallopeptidase [Flavobacterium sp. TSSA_36]|uniref:M56 family metallopeptidase n=1 Tax=Flavobacterium sp. TSSA_36 TaxID=3447669 RepID=UPI003F373335